MLEAIRHNSIRYKAEGHHIHTDTDRRLVASYTPLMTIVPGGLKKKEVIGAEDLSRALLARRKSGTKWMARQN